MNIRLMSWNTTGVMTGIPYLTKELCARNISVCGLSEHWLYSHNVNILDSLDTNYSSYAVCCSNPASFNGRLIGKGGVALLWHHSLDNFIESVPIESDRLIAIRLCLPDISVIIIQVYLPSSNLSIDTFKLEVDKLNDVCSTYGATNSIIVMGDFNAKFASTVSTSGLRTRDAYVDSLARAHNLCCATDLDTCTGPMYTFYPYSDANPSRIDHILLDESLLPATVECLVASDAPLNVSRHLPIFLTLRIKSSTTHQVNSDAFTKKNYNWNQHRANANYRTRLNHEFSQRSIEFSEIDTAYEHILECMTTSAESTLKKREFKKFLKPYWSPALKDSHRSVVSSRLEWLADGKAHGSTSYSNYKATKRHFRRKLRAAAHCFEQEEIERIDQLAELDQKGFWKAINSKKPKSPKKRGCDITFNNVRATTKDSTLDGWRSYFQTLYTCSDDPHYDEPFKDHVSNSVTKYIDKTSHVDSKCDNVMCYDVTSAELQPIINSLPNNKSASHDNITYEHLKYGGDLLTLLIVRLFNEILKREHLPRGFKSGLTVTLHKGKGKSFSDPNNYRAISLLPVVYKLFEKLLHKRFTECDFTKKLNPLQHGFQKGKSCKMVSFLLQESRNYCNERHSPLHACYLDARSAFDVVWTSGLLYKLYHLGIRGKALRIIHDSFQGSSSRVLIDGHLSNPFCIERGTRQGSICAPFYYTVFVDNLLDQIQASAHGLRIGDLDLSAPTQADDIVLVTMSRNNLGALLKICSEYANKWRYSYNPAKCATMIMENKLHRSSFPALLYNNIALPEVSNYKHLGLTQSQAGKHPYNVDEVKSAIRGSFLSLANRLSDRASANPSTLGKLYTTCVLPRCLFGCELWNCITRKDIQQLEVAHHFCLKRAQGLPHRTRSDMVTGLLGMSSIEAYIDLQKLTFFGSLCRLPPTQLANKLLVYRIFQFTTCDTHQRRGFIPDIDRIMTKYDLQPYMQQFTDSGTFPNKAPWKRICRRRILTTEEAQWRSRLARTTGSTYFRLVHPYLTTANLWRVVRERPDALHDMKFLAKLLCLTPPDEDVTCDHCTCTYNNLLEHILCDCSGNNHIMARRDYQNLVRLTISEPVSDLLSCASRSQFIAYILGGVDGSLMNMMDVKLYPDLLIANAKLLKLLYSKH